MMKSAVTKPPLVLTACCAVVASRVGRAQQHADSLASLHGEVVDTALHPLPRVLVYLSRARTFGVSDTNGAFTLADVEPGVDTLEVRKGGFTPRDTGAVGGSIQRLWRGGHLDPVGRELHRTTTRCGVGLGQ